MFYPPFHGGFGHLLRVSQWEAHWRFSFSSSSLLRFSAVQGQRSSPLGDGALRTAPSQSPNILGSFSPSKASVGWEKGDRQIPGDKEEIFAVSALELVNVPCIPSSSSGAWLTFSWKICCCEASQGSCASGGCVIVQLNRVLHAVGLSLTIPGHLFL